MRNGWAELALGDVFKTVTGGTPPKSNPEYYGSFAPFVKPPELNNDLVAAADDGLSELGVSVARVAPPNSVLVSCIGILGKIGLAARDVAFNQQINAILPNETRAIPKFIFYQTLSDGFREQLAAMASGTTVSIVNKSKFNSIVVVVPPLPEQRRIVTILDKAFAGLATATANAEKNLKNARDLFESHREAIFFSGAAAWPERRLGEMCEIARGGSPRPIQKFITSAKDGINWIKIGDATASLKYIYKTAEKIKRAGLSRSRFVKEGDFLLSNSMSFGRPYIMRTTGCVHDGWLVLTDVKGNFDQDYLYHFLSSRSAYNQFDQFAAGSTVRNLNVDLVKRTKIVVPPLSEQRRAAERLERMAPRRPIPCLRSARMLSRNHRS